MTKQEVSYSIKQFEKALARLKEAIKEASGGDELKQDGTIKRFEFTFELFWKSLKIYLEYLGKLKASPRETFKEAFRQQILQEEQTYLAMLDDRNISTHAYDFEVTRRIFKQIKGKYVSAMGKPIRTIKANL